MTIFYIVRHGETEWNVKRLMQGQKDSPLTEKGLNQAKQIREKFKHIHFNKVFSSDLLRAKRTAEIITLERNLAVETTKRLREKSFGKYEGKNADNYLRDLFQNWESLSEKEKHKSKFVEEGESNEEASVRFITLLREIAITYPKKTILIVTHGGLMRYTLIHLGYGTYQTLQNRAVGNTSYIKLESDGIDFFIREVKGVKKT
jgi:probable phosphoglycerate mutase